MGYAARTMRNLLLTLSILLCVPCSVDSAQARTADKKKLLIGGALDESLVPLLFRGQRVDTTLALLVTFYDAGTPDIANVACARPLEPSPFTVACVNLNTGERAQCRTGDSFDCAEKLK